MAFRITLATALLVLTIIGSVTANTIYGQVITLEPLPIAQNTISLNVSFSNGTNATLTNEPITEEQGNLIVSATNSVLSNLEDDLEDLELEPEEEIEEIEESDSDNGGDGGGGDDNGDNNNGNDDEPPEEPEEPILPEPPGGDEEGESDSEQELELKVITKGCAEGLGYHVNDPNPRCYPLDSIGEEPPEGIAFCAALGCPWNSPNIDPSDLSKD